MQIYNFYSFLEVRCIDNGHGGYKRYFDNEYLKITGNTTKTQSDIPAITVSIVKSLPKKRAGDLSRSNHYKKLFNYSYMVRGLHTDNVEIFFETHPVDKLYMNAIGVFLQAQVLEPIMYLKFLERGVLFMHAGGVSRNGRGYLLPAYGGTGKTTFSIALMNNGFQLLGDDLLVVDTKERVVYPYQRPLHLFTYNINNLNGARVPLKYKAAIYAKNNIRKVLERTLKTEFLISTRVHADEIFEGDLSSSPVPYKGIYFLRKDGDATTNIVINSKNSADVAREIMQSEDLNDSLYEILQDKSEITKTEKLEVEVISKILLQLKKLTYVNTRKLDLKSKDIGKILENS